MIDSHDNAQRVPTPEEVRKEIADGLIMDIVQERRQERRWKRIKRITVAVAFMIGAFLYIGNYAGVLGYRLLPMSETVAVVPITGPIGMGQSASADAINPMMRRLFNRDAVVGIVLLINSGGGSPAEAERITRLMDELREQTNKPIYAACSSMCASAAYMIALHTDRVYAGEYSWVGSIGAVLKVWDLKDVAERLQVNQRVFASGPMKDFLNPYKELSPEMHDKTTELVNKTAANFFDEVRNERNGRLIENEEGLFTGEVWSAKDSLEFGLIDEIATLEQVVAANFEGIPTKTFTPKKKRNSFLDRFASELATAISERLTGSHQQPEITM